MDPGRNRDAPTVRVATTDDIDGCVALLIASITTLCAGDHLNDPPTLERWLRNKTSEHFGRWLADEENLIMVAELGSTLSGVALLKRNGTIHLCYVLPGMQRQGVGRALIRRVESEAASLGLRELALPSTGSARHFYERLGFTPNGAPNTAYGVLKQYPYVKVLG
jgi:GNAT superfamily N-acetyltransferase